MPSQSNATPRLLGRRPWLLPVMLLLAAGAVLASKRAEQPERQKRTSALQIPAELPREPPVELLSVPNSGFPCAVDAVLEAKCRRCHTRPTRHAAPFALLTWAETRAYRHQTEVHVLMERAIKGGTMPQRIPANPPIEPLTADERWVLLDWLGKGAPRGSCP